jgi:hypothetical protein
MTGQLVYQADRLRVVFLFLSSCRQQPTDSNRTSASNDQLPLELAGGILYLAMGAGCGTRLSSHRYRAKIETTISFGSNMLFAASSLIKVSSCSIVFFGLLITPRSVVRRVRK